MDTNLFLLSWDCNGLEACVDITEDYERAGVFDKESLFERIANPEVEPQNQPLRNITSKINMMSMRARFNPQRNYEIYTVNTTKDVSKDDLEQMFEETPQEAADMIRVRGTKLLSYRNNTPERKIT